MSFTKHLTITFPSLFFNIFMSLPVVWPQRIFFTLSGGPSLSSVFLYSIRYMLYYMLMHIKQIESVFAYEKQHNFVLQTLCVAMAILVLLETWAHVTYGYLCEEDSVPGSYYVGAAVRVSFYVRNFQTCFMPPPPQVIFGACSFRPEFL